MKTLYGLTEAQMWEVHRVCERENWRSMIECAADNQYPEYNFSDLEIEDATTIAMKEYNFVDIRADVEPDIICQALAEIYDKATEESED